MAVLLIKEDGKRLNDLASHLLSCAAKECIGRIEQKIYQSSGLLPPPIPRGFDRSSSYLPVLLTPDDRASYSATAYYQFDLEESSDVRVLGEAALSFELTDRLSMVALG